MSDVEKGPKTIDSKSNSKEDGGEPTSASRRKPQFRWNYERDLTMVTEIEKVQPFTESSKESVKLWSAVADAVNSKYHGAVDSIGVKRRFERILKTFEKEDKIHRDETGKEEEPSELEAKLDNLSPLVRDLEEIKADSKEKKKHKVEINKEKAEEIRGAAMSTLKNNDDLGTPESPQQFTRKLKPTGDGDLVELWKEKQEQDNKKFKADQDIKAQELQLKNATLQFEKQKFEHQRQLDMERMQIDKANHDSDQEERRLQLQTQKLMLELLMKK